VQILFDRLFPHVRKEGEAAQNLQELLAENGFDPAQHEQIRSDLRAGRIGLAQNRLAASATIRDVEPEDLFDATSELPKRFSEIGNDALRKGEAAVVTLAAGVGSRWTQGAGVVKALHPFAKLKGVHRTFIETHLAKTRRTSRVLGVEIPHVFTTSYLTHGPTEEFLRRENNYGYIGPIFLSQGKSIGLRMIPMARDLRFAWEEVAQQVLDEQKQKVRESLHAALIKWARARGEGSDYTDNVPLQCMHPVGHWFEAPNMLRNGVLMRLLEKNPNLKIFAPAQYRHARRRFGSRCFGSPH